MTYVSGFGGALALAGAGIGYHSLSGTFPIRQEADAMRDLQQQLQRLGYLQSGAGVYGADGKFGPRTATALRGAASYVGWSGAPYSPSNAGELRSGSVTVPDDLIERIRSARPNPAAPYAAGVPVPADAPVEPQPDGAIVIGPHLDPEPAPASGDDSGWVLPVAIAGGVLVVGGVIAWQMGKTKPRGRRRAVAANRRRKRRRRTSRRR